MTATTATRRCAARPQGPYGIDAPRKCTQPTHRATAALCRKHEQLWKIESKQRRAAARAAEAEHDGDPEVWTPDGQPTTPLADDSIAARNLAALKAKRAAQRVA